MTRSSGFKRSVYLAKDHEPADTRRAIHAQRLAKLLPVIAARHGIASVQLEAMAAQTLSLCAICVGPMPTPKLYRIENHPIALLCGHCSAAIEKTGGMLNKLNRHWRFNIDHKRNRGRLTRFIALHSNLPDELRFDRVEERKRIELLEEDQAIDDLLIEDNESR